MKSIAVKYLSHTATAATMTTTKIATMIWQRWQGETVMGMAMIKTKVLIIMFTVKVAVDMTVATTTMAENNTQQK